MLATVDWRASMARYRASLSDWDLRGELPDGHGTTFLLSRRLLDESGSTRQPDAPPRRLTTDGNNDNVARSATGRLLIQSRRGSDGYVIMLFEPGSIAPHLTTPGPARRHAGVLARGDDWFYIRSDRDAIVHCDAVNSCTEIHADPPGPDLAGAIAQFPKRRVPHLAQYARLKMLSLVGRSRARSRRGDRRLRAGVDR